MPKFFFFAVYFYQALDTPWATLVCQRTLAACCQRRIDQANAASVTTQKCIFHLFLAGTVSVIVFVTWRIVFLIVPLAFFYAVIGKMYIMTSRELRRLESNTKGPILAFFAETLVGVETVRAFGSQNRFIHENEKRINENTKPMLLNVASNRWLSKFHTPSNHHQHQQQRWTQTVPK